MTGYTEPDEGTMKRILVSAICWTLLPATIIGQENPKTETPSDQVDALNTPRRHYLGSSLFVLYNLFPDAPDFFQLTYGYQLSPKDALILEAITWKYSEPLGTYGDSKEEYPGKVRSFGIGIGYQRFHWRNAYTTLEATPFLQQFYDEADEKIQRGFQLYCQLILGYRVEFFAKRLYVEPAWALKYWPVNSNLPDAFAEIEEGTPKHIFEPSLHFGVRF